MRKNKDLDKYFQSFIDDLTLLFEDSNNIFSTNYKKLLKTLKEMDRIAEKTGQIDGKTESRGKNRNVKKLANSPEDLVELIYLLNKNELFVTVSDDTHIFFKLSVYNDSVYIMCDH